MNKNTLYLECFSGISGDMTVAALLDLGANEDKLLTALQSLPLAGYRVKISDVQKSGVRAKDFDVVLDHANHDHDMEYLYGHTHAESHDHGHAAHAHDHTHPKHHAHHEHRGMKEIRGIIDAGALSDGAKARALSIFQVLAEAEATVHGTTVEEVHFHEVGAVDSIIDIAAIGICLDDLSITDVITPVIYEGQGTVRCQHGILPVPVPAVAEIVSRYQIRLHRMELAGEFVTPTGAATVAAITTGDALPKEYRILKTGIGAGKRVYDGPGVLRAMLIE